jgi:DNA-binding MarR family transcriptional regulator
MNIILEERLQKIGLSITQSKIYLLLLRKGKAQLHEVMKELAMSRSTTCWNLERLRERQLIIIEKMPKRRAFFVRAPNHGLRLYMEQKEDALLEEKKMLMQAIDGFQHQYESLGDKPGVKFFQGKEMLAATHSEVWNMDFQEAYEFCNLDESYKLAPRKKGDHRTQFRKLKKKWNCIYTCSKGPILPHRDGRYGKNYYLPQEEFPFKGELAIF